MFLPDKRDVLVQLFGVPSLLGLRGKVLLVEMGYVRVFVLPTRVGKVCFIDLSPPSIFVKTTTRPSERRDYVLIIRDVEKIFHCTTLQASVNYGLFISTQFTYYTKESS